MSASITRESLLQHRNIQLGGKQANFIYLYYNAQGQIVCVIARWQTGQDKECRPFRPITNDNGNVIGWKQGGISKPYPLYNLPSIINNPHKPILIVEGEKTADAAQQLFPDYVVTTTMFGAGSPQHTDFSPLKSRDIIICRDYDKAGQNYLYKVIELCRGVGVSNTPELPIKIFGEWKIQGQNITQDKRTLPESYDLADAYEEGWRKEYIQQLIQQNEPIIIPITLSDDDQNLEDILQETSINYENDWSTPEPIKETLLPVQKLLPDMLPEGLRVWLQDISYRMQSPLDYVAIPTLIMLSSVIGTRCFMRPKQKDTWLVAPNLWGGIIGRPGSKKSPALSAVLSTLEVLEKESYEQYQSEHLSFRREEECYKLKKEATASKLKKSIKDPHTSNVEEEFRKILESQPNAPILRRYKTNDTTIEKLTELLQDNPQGLLVMRDELTGLLISWDREGHETDRAFFLEAWNGYGSYTTDRIGRGTIRCNNICVSIIGSTQPDKLKHYLYKAQKDNDGLLQRFQLLVYPAEITKYKFVDEHPHAEAAERMGNIAHKIAHMDFTAFGAERDESSGKVYFRFCADAQSIFNKWTTNHESSLHAEDDNLLAEHRAKYSKLVTALSLIFHVIDSADQKCSGPITVEAIEKAIRWCEYLESHARCIYGLMPSTRIQSAKALLKKLQLKVLNDGFTLREVYRSQWRYLSSPDEARSACEELVELGYLKMDKIKVTNRSSLVEIYLINPQLYDEEFKNELPITTDTTDSTPISNSMSVLSVPSSSLLEKNEHIPEQFINQGEYDYEIQERAAILEFDAQLPRPEAEALALVYYN